MKDANEVDMKTDIEQIKETLSKMQAQIDVLEDKFNCINPQCIISAPCTAPIFSLDYPLSLSAAKSLWPYMEHEFDEYCTKHNITTWTPTDGLNFYNEYIGVGADWPSDNDTQNG